MPRPASRHPTDRELDILKHLWESGPATVRQVRAALRNSGRADPAYTSLMTVMSTMVQKGYLKRHKRGNGYIYEPHIPRSRTTRDMLHDLIGRAFDGSAANVALGLLKDTDLDATQIQELKDLVNHKSREEP